jgi:hypothetical protein
LAQGWQAWHARRGSRAMEWRTSSVGVTMHPPPHRCHGALAWSAMHALPCCSPGGAGAAGRAHQHPRHSSGRRGRGRCMDTWRQRQVGARRREEEGAGPRGGVGAKAQRRVPPRRGRRSRDETVGWPGRLADATTSTVCANSESGYRWLGPGVGTRPRWFQPSRLPVIAARYLAHPGGSPTLPLTPPPRSHSRPPTPALWRPHRQPPFRAIPGHRRPHRHLAPGGRRLYDS